MRRVQQLSIDKSILLRVWCICPDGLAGFQTGLTTPLRNPGRSGATKEYRPAGGTERTETMAKKAKLAANGAFKIEKGVRFPGHGRSKGYGSKYPFADMKVGDSFATPTAARDATAQANNLRAAARHWAQFHWAQFRGIKAKFSARVVDGVARIWRIE
jgi:hypothetical protein